VWDLVIELWIGTRCLSVSNSFSYHRVQLFLPCERNTMLLEPRMTTRRILEFWWWPRRQETHVPSSLSRFLLEVSWMPLEPDAFQTNCSNTLISVSRWYNDAKPYCLHRYHEPSTHGLCDEHEYDLSTLQQLLIFLCCAGSSIISGLYHAFTVGNDDKAYVLFHVQLGVQ